MSRILPWDDLLKVTLGALRDAKKTARELARTILVLRLNSSWQCINGICAGRWPMLADNCRFCAFGQKRVMHGGAGHGMIIALLIGVSGEQLMSLEESLAKIREASAGRIPPEAREVIGRTNEELRNSGILDGAVKAGDNLPAFSLPNAYGELVESNSLLARGPVVLTIFRGHW
jgi:hypothetical protein